MMAPDEADVFLAAQRRKRWRDRLVMLGVLAGAALVAFGFYMRRERTVWFKGPDRDVILHLADRDPIPVGPNEVFGARLRPGTYKLTVEGVPDGLTQIRVPYVVNSTLALPLTSDQCFVVANAEGLYTLEGNRSGGDLGILQITQPGEAASLASFPLRSNSFEMDVCRLPRGKRLMDSVFVVELVSCREQLTVRDAQRLLLARRAVCGLREPATE
jgi:hypothetical protein